jgi:hypothetical protein
MGLGLLKLWGIGAGLIALALVAGCGGRTPGPSESNRAAQPGALAGGTRLHDPNDPCQERLHDIEGALIGYLHFARQPPQTLQDLLKVDPKLQLTCPVSGQPYIYDPVGVRVWMYNTAGQRVGYAPGSVVIYDALPIHRGERYGILLENRAAGMSPQADVVAVTEEDLRNHATEP